VLIPFPRLRFPFPPQVFDLLRVGLFVLFFVEVPFFSRSVFCLALPRLQAFQVHVLNKSSLRSLSELLGSQSFSFLTLSCRFSFLTLFLFFFQLFTVLNHSPVMPVVFLLLWLISLLHYQALSPLLLFFNAFSPPFPPPPRSPRQRFYISRLSPYPSNTPLWNVSPPLWPGRHRLYPSFHSYLYFPSLFICP